MRHRASSAVDLASGDGRCLLAGLAALLVASPLAQAAEAPPSPLPLHWALRVADEANPDIALQTALRDAAHERIRPAGSLEDPRFSYEASNMPIGRSAFDSTPLSGNQFGLRQKIPFPGLLGARREAARAGSRAADHSLENRRLEVEGAVERAWAELGFAQRALAITRRNIELLRQLAAIAEAKYRVGNGLQQDVLRAQVELTRLLEEELRREAAVDVEGARLGALLDLPPGLELPRTASLADTAPVPSLDALLERLEVRSPGLAALRAQVEEAERRVRVVELEGYPDFDLGVGYRLRQRVSGDPVEGDDFLSAGLTLRLPVDRGKWRARAAEARAEHRRAEAAYRGALAMLRERVRSAHAELVRADAEDRLVRSGLLPQAEQSLESSRSGYEVGRIDFLSLLDSQVSLLRAELRGVRALADRRTAYAALEVAAGEKLR